MYYIKIVFFLLSLLVLVQAQSNEENSSNGLNATKIIITDSIDEIVLTLNNYVTSFVQFIISIQKSVRSFVQQVQVNDKPFTNVTEFKRFIHDLALEHSRSPNASCLVLENLATYNLLNVTEQKIARCLSDINPLTQEVNMLFSNLLQQITSAISNIVQNISNCVQNSPNMLTELPACLATNINAFSTEFGSVGTQLTNTLSNAFQNIGQVTNATTVCLNEAAHQCLKKAFAVITDFANCTYNS